jgi:hypothetical protein
MEPWLIVLLALVALLLLLVVVIRWAGRGLAAAQSQLSEVASGRTPKRQSPAQSFGLRSKGPAQWRGAGYLALFDDELVFVQAIASNHVRAKRSDIIGVTTPRSFLGKSQGVKLLAVEWRTGEGGTEQVALRVPDLDAWVADLGGVTGESR